MVRDCSFYAVIYCIKKKKKINLSHTVESGLSYTTITRQYFLPCSNVGPHKVGWILLENKRNKTESCSKLFLLEFYSLVVVLDKR